jgi:hypothetical protein
MISASGYAFLIPSAAASLASIEVRHPLNESMAIMTFMLEKIVICELYLVVHISSFIIKNESQDLLLHLLKNDFN